MTELPPLEAPARTSSEDQVLPAAAYALYLLGLATGGITSILGLIIAYAQRERAGPTGRSHYDFLIRTFWLTLLATIVLAVAGALLMLIGIPLSIVLVGIPLVALGGVSWVLMGLVGVWYAVRCIVGVIFLARSEPYPRPRTWLI
jgi:uncharacterized membrane protein